MSVGVWVPRPAQLPAADLQRVEDLVEHAATHAPDRAAVVTARGVLTYRELSSVIAGCAARLRDAGVRRGDRVLISLAAPEAAVGWLFAALRVGAAFVMAAPEAPAEALRHVADDAEARLAVLDPLDPRGAGLSAWTPVVAGDDYRPGPPARSAPAAGLATDTACLIYTSGTTGRPRGIVCPHRSMVFAVEAISRVLSLGPSDVVGSILPLTFDYGLYQVLLAFRATATVVLGGLDDAVRMGAFIVRHGVTVLPVVPSLADRLARLLSRRPERTGSVRLVTSTGERLAEPVADRLRRVCPNAVVLPMYGLTECKRVAIATPADVAAAPRSVGRPLPGTEVMIVNPVGGGPLPPGTTGEIVVRGPHVMSGYHRAPGPTAARFRPYGEGGEPALFTGDLGHLDDAGRLYVAGRADDQFKVAGTRVSRGEVEHAALAVPGVQGAAVVSPADDEPYTLVVTGDVTAADVRERLRAMLEPAKVPDRVVLVGELPTTPHGKRDLAAVRRELGGDGRGTR